MQILRPARPEDLGPVLGLLEQAGLPVNGVRECFGSFVVAAESDEVVGAAGLEVYGSHGLLRSLVVREDRRGLGLGDALARAVLAQAAASRLDAVYLLTETAESFFARLGFEVIEREEVSMAVKRSAEFTDLCPATAVVMFRSITHA